jgi:hypothetical protein
MTYAVYNRTDWEMKPEMNILFYAGNGAGKELQETIETLSLDMEVYRNLANLLERLRHPLNDPTIAVLVADSRERLEELLVLRHLFRNVRVILVLPDRESGTISKGHDLHARFLTYIDSDPVEVALVLSKIAEQRRQTK